jgi:hypothetical protein
LRQIEAVGERRSSGPQLKKIATDAALRLEWSARWLDERYAPAIVSTQATGSAEQRLRLIADAFDGLLETFEEEDPVAYANAIQTSSLSFAIVSATASYLRRAARGLGLK